MPTYTYRCETCGIVFDRVQSFNDKPLSICPECEGDVKRVMQPAAIVFKGSGWYATDHRSPSGQNKKPEKAASGESTPAENKDPKPATPPPSTSTNPSAKE